MTDTAPGDVIGISPAAEDDTAVRYAVALHTMTPTVRLMPAVLAVNVFVFVVMVASGAGLLEPTVGSLIAWGANYGPRTTGGEWWRLLTSTFVHVGVIHVGMNMLVLANIGPFMERVLGRAGVLVMYLTGGIAGSLASLAWNPFAVSAGASGAIFGLYGGLCAYLLRFRDDIPTAALEGLQKGAVTFIGYNVLFGFVRQGVDVAAHFGGLAGGFAIGLLVCHAPNVGEAARRVPRALVAAALSIVLAAGAAKALPQTADMDAAMKGFVAAETKAVDAYNAASGDFVANKIGNAEFADRLDRDVLTPWRAARPSIAGLTGLPTEQQALVAKLLKYLDARTAAWTLMEDGARDHEPAKLQRGLADLKATADIMKDPKTVPPQPIRPATKRGSRPR